MKIAPYKWDAINAQRVIRSFEAGRQFQICDPEDPEVGMIVTKEDIDGPVTIIYNKRAKEVCHDS